MGVGSEPSGGKLCRFPSLPAAESMWTDHPLLTYHRSNAAAKPELNSDGRVRRPINASVGCSLACALLSALPRRQQLDDLTARHLKSKSVIPAVPGTDAGAVPVLLVMVMPRKLA